MKFELDYSEIELLEEKFKRLPENVEQTVNTYLHKEGVSHTTKDITALIPVSVPTKPGKLKSHARFRKWSTDEKENLGFTVKSRGGAANRPGSYGYLVFPNEGRGPRNHKEQSFMERGLERATPRIINGIHDEIDKKIEEVLS
ncbi:hypothetical protein [Alkalihalobacillus pseudalcaliphilus]|uniref:hypothetical protein n=1 Tax=Alkalihalobacillus pseudalcaliphilus TaxID=79884 RepID=UPI00064DF7E0|nr:hypothetical protein [Alkalihalobacillus pseudalcaliphilus]KMK77623.1 hypothetical protein AB990_03950 [Alkalihalobacillus pseudalcaliphilus]